MLQLQAFATSMRRATLSMWGMSQRACTFAWVPQSARMHTQTNNSTIVAQPQLTQRTVSKTVRLSGVALHSGQQVKLEIRPAMPWSGIRFVLPNNPGHALPATFEIPALFQNVTNTQLCTRISNIHETSEIFPSCSTIEHICSALWASGVTNAVVSLHTFPSSGHNSHNIVPLSRHKLHNSPPSDPKLHNKFSPEPKIHNPFPDFFPPEPKVHNPLPDIFPPEHKVHNPLPDIFPPEAKIHNPLPNSLPREREIGNPFPDIFPPEPKVHNPLPDSLPNEPEIQHNLPHIFPPEPKLPDHFPNSSPPHSSEIHKPFPPESKSHDRFSVKPKLHNTFSSDSNSNNGIPSSGAVVEVPLMDGSALPFMDAILEDGLVVQSPHHVPVFRLLRSVRVEEGTSWAVIRPWIEEEEEQHPQQQQQQQHQQQQQQQQNQCISDPRLSFKITVDYLGLSGGQPHSFEYTHHYTDQDSEAKRWSDEIAPARTFTMSDQVEAAKRAGLVRGGTLENAVVFPGDGGIEPLNIEGLRFENEWVRHKMLDCMGDLSLVGMGFVHGRVEMNRPGHKLNNMLLRSLFADRSNYDIIRC